MKEGRSGRTAAMTLPALIAASFGALVTGGIVILILGVGSALATGRNNTGIDGIGLVMLVVGIGGLAGGRRWYRQQQMRASTPDPAEEPEQK